MALAHPSPGLNKVIDEAMVMANDSDDQRLAHDMIEVHGMEPP